MSRTESYECILLRDSDVQLILTFEVAFIQDFNGILLAIVLVSSKPYLLRECHELPGSNVAKTPTSEYEPSPSTRPNSKSLALIRPLTELFLDLDWAREAGGLSSVGLSSVALSSESSSIPNSRARYAGGLDPRGVLGD